MSERMHSAHKTKHMVEDPFIFVEVSTYTIPISWANTLALSKLILRLELESYSFVRSILLPTKILVIFGSARFSRFFSHLSTFKKESSFVTSNMIRAAQILIIFTLYSNLEISIEIFLDLQCPKSSVLSFFHLSLLL